MQQRLLESTAYCMGRLICMPIADNGKSAILQQLNRYWEITLDLLCLLQLLGAPEITAKVSPRAPLPFVPPSALCFHSLPSCNHPSMSSFYAISPAASPPPRAYLHTLIPTSTFHHSSCYLFFFFFLNLLATYPIYSLSVASGEM